MKPKGLFPSYRLILLLTLSIVLLLMDSKTEMFSQGRAVVSVVALPIHMVASSPVLFFRWIGNDLEDWGELKQKYTVLQRQHLIMQSRLQQFDALQAENMRLRKIIGAESKLSEEALFARIVEVHPDLYNQTVLVDRGAGDGVYVGQAVIGPAGVIGQVVRVGLFRSSIMLITDSSQGIPVQFVRSGIRTIVYGSDQGNLLSAPYLARTADVRRGDLFVTSGLGDLYPEGYPVGTIKEIDSDVNSPFLSVVAEPTAQPSAVREVLLISHNGNKITATDLEKMSN